MSRRPTLYDRELMRLVREKQEEMAWYLLAKNNLARDRMADFGLRGIHNRQLAKEIAMRSGVIRVLSPAIAAHERETWAVA